MVDDGVAQHAVKPGDRRLLASQLVDFVETARERFLKDVFCQHAIADAPFEKAEELAMIVDEHADDVWGRLACVRGLRSEVVLMHAGRSARGCDLQQDPMRRTAERSCAGRDRGRGFVHLHDAAHPGP